ncbi:glycosyltransferase family 39 protein [Castellaniella sp. GW247-6E4]|uniref:ArnT family glycosyltransferase n=1 Tax=Castellaniella sp. GW247-6E4 TaxID=3140380 RepID=UPI003314870B
MRPSAAAGALRGRWSRLVDSGQRLLIRGQALGSWPWVAGLTFLWLAATTWVYPLLLPDEGRYVGVAWHMLESGDYLTPMLDGMPFFHKPPLFYWLTASSLALFGANAWAARLCSVLAATVLVTLFHRFLRVRANPRIAGYATLILAIQPFLFGASHYANLDMLVGAVIGLTVMAGATAVFRHEQTRPDRAAVLCMYAAAAFGFLAKGLIGVVLPGGVLFFWLLGRRRFAAMRRLLWWPGILLFLVLSLPWMAAMQARHPGFFDYYIVYQHFQRFLESGFNNPHPFWFYVPVLLGLTLPWSVQLWRWGRRDGPANLAFVPPAETFEQVDRPVLRGLMLSWLLVILVFFSIPASKLVGYVIAALPPLAWFIAEVFEARAANDRARAERGLAASALIAVLICAVAVLTMVVAPQPSNKPLARVLAEQAGPDDRLVMLDLYAYDVPFYAHRATPSIVVADWDDPELPRSDNWRRELYDAGLFAPETARDVLWRAAQWHAALCAPNRPVYWVMAYLKEASGQPALQGLAPLASTRRMGLWRLAPDDALSVCAETPSSAPE